MGKEQELLKLLREHKGTTMTIREIAGVMGLKSTGNVHRLLRLLRAQGHIDWDPKKARTIRVLTDA